MLNLLRLTTSSKGFVPTSTTVFYNFIQFSMKTYHKSFLDELKNIFPTF